MDTLLAFSRTIDAINIRLGKWVSWLILLVVLISAANATIRKLFDTSSKVRASTGVQTLPAPLSVTTSVSHYEPGNVQIDLSAPAPDGASLVVSENYYPGWKATVDGKAAQIGRADFAFIGVELPAGARSVHLDFTSPSYQRGKVITWFAIIFGFFMLGAGIWRDRRVLA